MSDLILTEKPSVASDFAKALGVTRKADGFFEGNGYLITWAVGHLVSLYDPEDYDPALKKWRVDTLPILPDVFRYKPILQNLKQLNVIKRLLNRSTINQVIIATDAGREGEVIARTILLEAGFTDKTRIKRFWTSQALVPEVVRNTMEQLQPVTHYDRLWRAGYYRQVADWLVGMNCTRVLTVRLNDLFSVGRVQTAVLAMLVNRKKERDAFVPKPYWTLKVHFENKKGAWTGHWYHQQAGTSNETRLYTKEAITALETKLCHEPSAGTVTRVDKKTKEDPPPLLFSLTDLQQTANKRFGFSAKQTLTLAQRLYQDKKCLSYPRTDARVLGSQNLPLVNQVIDTLSNTYGAMFQGLDSSKLSLANKRVFNDAKLTDHHALIPFKPLPAGASADEKVLFDLVVKRFAAAFHPHCRYEQTRVTTLFSGETFQTHGKVILEPGWQRVYQTADSAAGKPEDKPIPPLAAGDPANRKTVIAEEKETTPPPAYTDALILKDMTNPGKYVDEDDIKKLFRGDVGIGTQSTRAQIIETLLSRRYVFRKGKTLEASDKGVFLIEAIEKTGCSRVLASPEETARWEMTLNTIATGDSHNTDFLNQIKTFVTRSVGELKTADFPAYIKSASQIDQPNVGTCPQCGGAVAENRKAYGCTGKQPEKKGCGFVIWKRIAGKAISTKMASNLLKYRKSGPFQGFVSKKKKRFSAMLTITSETGRYQVGLDFDAGKTKPAHRPTRPTAINTCCPVCGGQLLEGSKGYGCMNWKPENGGCRFVIWKTLFGKKLSVQNVETLVNGNKTRPYVFKDKSGNKFRGSIKLTQAPEKSFFLTLIPQEGTNPDTPLTLPCRHG